MIAMDSNDFQVVRDGVMGEKAVDEQTFVSLAVLQERLERLRKLDSKFSRIDFSSAVKALNSQKQLVVC